MEGVVINFIIKDITVTQMGPDKNFINDHLCCFG